MMRSGFTTGSCAAAAAKAASYMLFTKRRKNNISIITPIGAVYEANVEMIDITDEYVSCGIKKDAGDDPDITNGIYICAKVSRNYGASERVTIKGGSGVGIVTRPGLEMPVGEAAINSTPRKMITDEVLEVLDNLDVDENLLVEIFVPDGEIIGQKTFNPHMGVEGGISILGTTGIVEPMSNEAILRTIELDIKQKKSENMQTAILVPGNYGEVFLRDNYKVDEKKIVHFSNYVGFAIDKAIEVGFKRILIAGHTGKMIKVSGGIMNTHSKEADARLELMMAATFETMSKLEMPIDAALLDNILKQVTTTAALDLIDEKGILREVCEVILNKILYHLNKRAKNEAKIEVILYENKYGLLAKTENAEKYL